MQQGSEEAMMIDVDNDGQQTKRTNRAEIKVVGNRIYDSVNGKTCHQCRQKTMDFVASCKNQKLDKQCTIKFCHKCLMNRYGEKADTVDLVNDWKCPKCRGICNCSFCMKKRGYKPTGQLVRTAKASGFSSVSEFMDVRGPDNSGSDKILNDVAASPQKAFAPHEEIVVIPSGKHGKENSLDENFQKVSADCQEKSTKRKREGLKEICNGNRVYDAYQNNSSLKKPNVNEIPEIEMKSKGIDGIIFGEKKSSKIRASKDVSLDTANKPKEMEGGRRDVRVLNTVKNNNAGAKSTTAVESQKVKCAVNSENREIVVSCPLPKGISLTNVSGIELPPEDVGHALQFLEFCAVFGKALNVKKGEPEALLKELIHRRSGRQGKTTVVDHFHIKLLSLIQRDSGIARPTLNPANGRHLWLKALGHLFSGSGLELKDLQLDSLDGMDGYYDLDLTRKLRLLNFLCDETLGTVKLRNFIDVKKSKFVEGQKKAKEKVLAAKNKEKDLKQSLQNEVAKSVISEAGAPLSISEHDALISKIKSGVAQAHAEMLEAKGMVLRKRQISDAMRNEPLLLDGDGHVFWILKSYSADDTILLQDIKNWDGVAHDERWFTYSDEQRAEIEKYISSSRVKRLKIQDVGYNLPIGSNEAKV